MLPGMTTPSRSAIRVSLCAAAALATPLHAGDRMRTGQWEFTLTTANSTHTAAHCVTSDRTTVAARRTGACP